MGANAVKTIVMLLVLVVLSAIIGSQFSGSLSESYGAFYVIGFVVAMFGLLFMGDKSWMLVYILPMLLLGNPKIGPLLPIPFALSCALLCCCLIMWLMGHVKLHWHAAWGIDFPVLLLVFAMVVSFIRFPVSVNSLGIDFGYVGGMEYIWCLCALGHYLAVSVLTPKSPDMGKISKWSILFMMAMQVPYVLYAYFSSSAYQTEEGSAERYWFLYVPATTMIYYGYAKFPLEKLLHSVRTFLILGGGLVALMLTGGREYFLRGAFATVFLSFLKRELTVAVLLGLFSYGFVFILSEGGALQNIPKGAQRILTLLPGVEVDQGIQYGTAGSSETRRMIWAMGLDPRTGLIKDYIYGDGFRRSTAEVERGLVATMRGSTRTGLSKGKDRDRAWAYELASTGSWHNGWLTVVKKLGLVGLIIVNLYFLCGLVLTVKVSSAYSGTKEYPYIMAACLPFASIALSFVIGTQTFVHVFGTFLPLGFIKLLYCEARAKGKITPLFLKAQYVPLVIREQETPAATAR